MTSPDVWRDAVPHRGEWVRPPLITLVLAVLATGLTGWFFLYRPTGQVVDQLALLGARSYLDQGGSSLMGAVFEAAAAVTGAVVGLVGGWLITFVVIGIVALTWWQRKWWRGLGALVLFTGANLTTQAIKAWWDRPDLGLYDTYGNSWPSGHTTIAAAGVFAVLLLTPSRARWAVSLAGGIFITLMAWGTVINGWHRPSDTVGAICVSALWYVLVETIRRSVMRVPMENRVDNRVTTRLLDILAGIGAALGVGILAAVALTLPDTSVGSVEVAVQRLAFVGAFFGMTAVALGASRVLLSVGPREEEPRR